MKKVDPVEPEEFSPNEIAQQESITHRKEIQVIALTVEALSIFQGTVKKRENLKTLKAMKSCTRSCLLT